MALIKKMVRSINQVSDSLNNWFCRKFDWFFTNGIKAEYVKGWYQSSE